MPYKNPRLQSKSSFKGEARWYIDLLYPASQFIVDGWKISVGDTLPAELTTTNKASNHLEVEPTSTPQNLQVQRSVCS